MRFRAASRVFLAGLLALPVASGGRPQRPTVSLEGRPEISAPESVDPASSLTSAEVERIVSAAARQAALLGTRAVIAIVDRETNVLAVFRMDGAPRELRLIGRAGGAGSTVVHGFDGLRLLPNGSMPASNAIVAGPAVPDPTVLAALSKAGTAAIFQTSGNAFTTRTASFIVQDHFPPGIDFTAGGPLFGVQFSNLPCSDVKRADPAGRNLALPLGLSGDAGGLPLYRNGQPVGGIGVESDGIYTLDFAPAEEDFSSEESAAAAGVFEFAAPEAILGEQILVNGIRLPFTDTPAAIAPPGGAMPPGAYVPGFAARAGLPSRFTSVTVGGLAATADPRFFPFRTSATSAGLTASEVERIIAQALAQAYRTRAAIRRPLGSFAQVNISVVDASGVILGIARTPDAPLFGFDVSAQKARAAAFFSSPNAASALSAAGFASYVGNAGNERIFLNGSIAMSNRSVGFLSRPLFPDGIDGTEHGPFSRPLGQWSPFNTGLQSDLVAVAVASYITGVRPLTDPCTAIPAIANGIQIFPGSVPLYRGGTLVGGIGISGDGVDQDDIVAAMGSVGFEAPSEIRSDRVFVRTVRLPWVKFPRHPNL